MGIKSTALGVVLLLRTAQAWWQPEASTTWQIVLSEKLKDTSSGVEAYDFDLFDNPTSTITALHKDNRKAICYFSAGSWEKWRKDAGQFNKADLGKPLDGWPGERWLNTKSDAVRTIMKQRMDVAVQKGCDAIDPDNIDVYDNGGGGFGLTKADAINYVKFLASEGHKRGLAVGLKNGGALIPSVLSDFDFSVNEQCAQYNECKTFRPFITAGKPVFHIEYVKKNPPSSKIDKICSAPSTGGFSTLIKHLSLDEFFINCPDATASSAHNHNNDNPSAAPALQTRKAPCPSAKGNDNGAGDVTKSSFVLLMAGLMVGLLWAV